MSDNFNPMTGEPMQNQPGLNQPEGEVRFDPMTGQPIPVQQQYNSQYTEQRMQYDPLAGPRKSQKKNRAILFGVLAGVVVLIVVLAAVLVRSGVFSSPQKKILRAAVNTLQPGELMKDLDTSVFLAESDYTLAFEGTADYEGDTMSLEAAYQQNARQKKQTFNGRVTFDGTSVDFHEYMDEEQLLFSVPKIYPDALGYNFTEKKTGYIADVVGEDILDAIDVLCVSYINNLSVQKEIYGEYGRIFLENFEELKFENTKEAVFQIDGKERNCKGYTTTVTADDVEELLDELSDVYDEYNKDEINAVEKMLNAMAAGSYYTSPMDELKEEAEDMPDIEMTFYLYQKQIAAICAESEDGDGIKIEFRGGTTPMQNTIITCYDEAEEYVLQMLGETEGSVEKTRIVAAENGDSETLADISYDFKTGEMEIETEDLSVTGTLESTSKKLVFTTEEFELDGAIVSGSITLKKGSDVKKPDLDVFDIGTASEMDFYELGQDIQSFIYDLY